VRYLPSGPLFMPPVLALSIFRGVPAIISGAGALLQCLAMRFERLKVESTVGLVTCF